MIVTGRHLRTPQKKGTQLTAELEEDRGAGGTITV